VERGGNFPPVSLEYGHDGLARQVAVDHYDPQRYALTLLDGTEYVLDQDAGGIVTGVFLGKEVREELAVVSPLQLYLDLRQSGKRGPELADELKSQLFPRLLGDRCRDESVGTKPFRYIPAWAK